MKELSISKTESSLYPASTLQTAKAWDPWIQFREQIWSQGWRLLLSAIFCAAIGVVVWSYSINRVNINDGTTLSEQQKYTYNALTIGLILFAGLQFDVEIPTYFRSSLERVAGSLKWYLLTLRPYTPKQFSQIMHCESQTEVMMLMRDMLINRKHFSWKIFGFAGSWLLLRIAAQIAFATLGLTASVSTPIDEGYQGIARQGMGAAYVVNFNPIQLFDRGGEVTNETQLADAYQLGVVGEAEYSYDANDGIKSGYPFMVNNTDGSFSHWQVPLFDEALRYQSNSVGSSGFYSGRFVNTSASCTEARITGLPVVEDDDSVVPYILNGLEMNFSLPSTDFSKTFFRSNSMFSASEGSIGVDGNTRKANVDVYWSSTHDINSTDPSVQRFFHCTSYVSQVWRTKDDGHVDGGYITAQNSHLAMPDLQARILAGAIGGLDGQSFVVDEFYGLSDENDATYLSQFVVSLFPAEVISAMGEDDTVDAIAMNVPIAEEGYIVKATWRFTLLVLILIPFVHFVLIVLMLWLTWNIVVRDSEPYATALFLRDAVAHIPHGRILKGKEAAEMISGEMLYSWSQSGEDDFSTRYLTPIHDVQATGYTRRARKERRFTAGTYD